MWCLGFFVVEKNGRKKLKHKLLENLLRPPEPQTHAVFLLQLQTSITQSFLKLEHFLRQFLKTRSHAHTFGSSIQFSEGV